MPDVFAEISRALTEEFDVPADEIGPENTLQDLGVDSVAAVELADILQERLGITIGDDDLTTQNTVAEVIGVVAERAGA
ncbi:acyl carrier protein [Nocardiopsis sediminis]|uniref:Acyl carrier protein n=1 Tax=Nocardiopsis sediminis TaxID=1778267 RepID=A0ABV8FG75_9ACTN